MRWMERLRMAAMMLFQRRRQAARLNDELRFHLDQQIEENIAAGMDAEEARFAALRLFGNPALMSEEAHGTWMWNWLESTWRDARYGFRTLRRAPGFAAVTILVMALGIGATTSLFTIVRSVLLRPLPFRDPDKLVMVYEHFRYSPNGSASDNYNVVAPADFREWREQTHGFEDMAAWRWWGCNVTGDKGELPEVVAAASGSWNLFSLLGVQPALGRTFAANEDRLGANRVVILSWSLFQSRFGGNPQVIGNQVRLDSQPYTIIGVLPKWFSYPDPVVKLWVPYSIAFPANVLESHSNHQSYVVARLRSGRSAEAATREVSTLQYQIHLKNLDKPVAEDARFRPMIEDVVRNVRTPLLMLMGAVGCMLLIACLNVSNLLVARGAAKRKEVAIRGALGGSRLKLIREQITESLLISIAGGGLGLLLALSATKWVATHWQDLPRADAIHVDGTVLAFAILVVLASALLAGLLPAISSTGRSLLAALQEASRSIGGSASKAALRKTLLCAEVTLTVVLLISAGLLFKSFVNLRTSDLGCTTDNVLTVKYGLPDTQYDKREKIINFHQGLLQRVRSLPGVVAAGLVSVAPGDGWGGDSVFTIPEHPTQGPILELDAITRTADPGYFSAVQIPLLSGRFFSDEEAMGRTHHIIISKQFADQYFRGESPLGKHVKISWAGKDDPQEIIGVVGDTLHHIGRPVKAMVYFPILNGAPMWTTSATLVVRTANDPLSLAHPVQMQVAALDPQLPVYDVMTMPEIVGKATASQSFSASLVMAFAVLSLILAAVGLYGVLSYLVAQRVPEIGVRMALGAQRSEVLRLVLVDGMQPVMLGLVIGLAGGAGASLLIKSLLFGTRSLDPMVFSAMAATLLAVAVLASAVPALRACRIQPTEALRTE